MTVEPVLLYDTVVTLHLVHVVIVVYCLYALAHSHHLNVLFCTGVTSWVIINFISTRMTLRKHLSVGVRSQLQCTLCPSLMWVVRVHGRHLV